MNDLKNKQKVEKLNKGSRIHPTRKLAKRSTTTKSNEVEELSESDTEWNKSFQSNRVQNAVFREGDNVIEMEVEGTEFHSKGELSNDDSEEGEGVEKDVEEASVHESASQIVSEDEETQSLRSRSSG